MTERIGNFSESCIKCELRASNDKTCNTDSPFFPVGYVWDDVPFIFTKLCNLNGKLNSEKKSTVTDYHNQDHRHLNQKSLELEKV